MVMIVSADACRPDLQDLFARLAKYDHDAGLVTSGVDFLTRCKSRSEWSNAPGPDRKVERRTVPDCG